ncbi:MAG: hypothetical protein BZ138_08000 [Methanosphaera sp. rholeuAM270]|nr:MAG: hypothetical protein BZ138_08000 [Methanosphaera sp. rholeuAM270]
MVTVTLDYGLVSSVVIPLLVVLSFFLFMCMMEYKQDLELTERQRKRKHKEYMEYFDKYLELQNRYTALEKQYKQRAIDLAGLARDIHNEYTLETCLNCERYHRKEQYCIHKRLKGKCEYMISEKTLSRLLDENKLPRKGE